MDYNLYTASVCCFSGWQACVNYLGNSFMDVGLDCGM